MTLTDPFSPECRVFPVPFPLFHNLFLFTHPLGSRTEAVSDIWLRPLLVNTMIKTPSDHLLHSLEGLVPNDFERFKFKLQNTSLEKDQSRIPRGQLQKARPVRLATLLITHYGEECAVRLTLQVLRAINQNFLAEELHKATDPESLIQESGADGSAMSCSSGENKPKGLRIPDVLEGDRQRQSGDGAPSLPSSQPEAGRGTQKKPQGKRRDQKTSEGLDMLGKPGARNATLSSRKCPFPGKLQGDRGIDPSVRLRRNASSLGRLQGLNYGSLTGSLGRTKSKINEAHLPSGQKRPRSLEMTIFSGEREVPNPETLLSQEKMRSDNPDSAATLSEVATLNVGATVTPEKGFRNPEHSMSLKGGAFRNTLPNVTLTRAKTTWEHPESTGLSKKNGIAGQEPPEALTEVVGSEFHEPSDPEVPPSSGTSSTAVSPGKPRDEAVYVLGRAQEGDPVGGTHVRDSCRRSVASRDPKTSDSCSTSWLQSQAPLLVKNSGDCKQQEGLHMTSLSPKALPQCERHMRQAQLLFCEDHREPICLICRLSQEHRGHRVRPIEEAALEYKKQIETRKQRIRHQLKQLYHFLEEQEKFFMASLEELGQTLGHVRESYSTRASRDIALLNELIEEMEVKQSQPEWELMQDIGVTLHRAKMVTVPKPWATPPEVEKKMHLFYQKSEFVEKSMKYFSEILHSEMDTINVPELICAQTHAVNVILDTETAHPNLIFSNDLKSVRLGNKWDRLPDSPERFDSCIIALGLPSFLSGRHYWEVEVGNKTGWILGICKASMSRKGNMTLSPDNGYWVVMMTKRSEFQVSTIPPTRLQMTEPPRRVGIFLDYTTGDISFYNVTNKSVIYTFTSFSCSGPLQPIFSPGTHDGGKNTDPLIICPVGGQGPP
ncbi:pyrin isoform X3 [Prionailurus viverrinus]|uniref:pyrin isoform X3 n=1 Tax=Prionailurus viverrinus TaxID=61388 RepID=UPI001FF6D2D2|nr:pyrin isoform X3 [Prionailurus viverrinus]